MLGHLIQSTKAIGCPLVLVNVVVALQVAEGDRRPAGERPPPRLLVVLGYLAVPRPALPPLLRARDKRVRLHQVGEGAAQKEGGVAGDVDELRRRGKQRGRRAPAGRAAVQGLAAEVSEEPGLLHRRGLRYPRVAQDRRLEQPLPRRPPADRRR